MFEVFEGKSFARPVRDRLPFELISVSLRGEDFGHRVRSGCHLKQLHRLFVERASCGLKEVRKAKHLKRLDSEFPLDSLGLRPWDHVQRSLPRGGVLALQPRGCPKDVGHVLRLQLHSFLFVLASFCFQRLVQGSRPCERRPRDRSHC